jgi:hypothetical protein
VARAQVPTKLSEPRGLTVRADRARVFLREREVLAREKEELLTKLSGMSAVSGYACAWCERGGRGASGPHVMVLVPWFRHCLFDGQKGQLYIDENQLLSPLDDLAEITVGPQ